MGPLAGCWWGAAWGMSENDKCQYLAPMRLDVNDLIKINALTQRSGFNNPTSGWFLVVLDGFLNDSGLSKRR